MADSLSHRAVRPLVPVLLRLRATPNQVTTVRLVIGLAATASVAWGSAESRLWGGLLWILGCLLDRLDGELARIGGMSSPQGAAYDTAVDRWMSALFFLGLGASLHGGPLAVPGLLCGLAACAAQHRACLVADRYDDLSESDKVIPSRWGFDADDAYYVLGPLAWLSYAGRFTASVLAVVGTLVFLTVFVVRLSRLRRRTAERSVPAG